MVGLLSLNLMYDDYDDTIYVMNTLFGYFIYYTFLILHSLYIGK